MVGRFSNASPDPGAGLATPPHENGETWGRGLLSRSFLGLLLTQFFGATNDNLLRWLVIGVGKQYVEESQVGWILAAGTVAFVLPYILLAAPSGYLADAFSKRTVIVGCKLAEIGIMLLAIASIVMGSATLMLLSVALMGAQSALFGPSKLGSIPEMLDETKISAANGLIGLTTVIATTVGSGLGMWLADATGVKGQERWWLSAVILVSISMVGLATSLAIEYLPVANSKRKFPWNLARQTVRDLRTLSSQRAMLRVALGIMFFWSLGALFQLSIDQFAFEGGATEQSQVTPLLIALVTGVGLGSILAGYWSGGRVELGILPLGAGGLAVTSLLLFAVKGTLINPSHHWTVSYVLACLLLFLMGCSAGLFDVPLAAFMQHRSDPKQRGSVLAASNFLTFSGILMAAVAFGLMRTEVLGHPLLSARQIFLLCGMLTLPVFVYIACLIPQASIRFLAWLVTHTTYRVRLFQAENLPKEGPALLIANHISWLDGLLLVAVSPRPIRLIVSTNLLSSWWSRGLARIMGAIPVGRAPKAAWSAIETARAALLNDELVCIFPEGRINRSSQLQAFKAGALEIVRGTSAPMVPVYLDELWGSIFSFHGGRFFWKWPRRWSRNISIWFGRPVGKVDTIYSVRQAVKDLSADAVTGRKGHTMLLPQEMIRKCRKAMFRWKVADSTGMRLTGGSLLMRSLVLRRLLTREVLQEDEKYVGILLPPSVGAVVTNAALTFSKRVAVNLNYTTSSDTLNQCIGKAGIRHVLTSRKVLEKLGLKIDAEIVFLEDLREQLTLADKLAATAMTYAMPASLLDRLLGLHTLQGDDELTVIFTSGSTGDPKGVILTFHNIGTNVEAVDHVVQLRRSDIVLGILPFFHSFGYMVTLWVPLGLDVRSVYHFTPLDARQVGKLPRKWGATVLLSTPTFLRSYLRRCEKADFEKMDIVVTGAEKMPMPLAAAFEEKFGVRPVEGYGITELSPLVSVNVPLSRSLADQTDSKFGTVGRPIPGVATKIVDPDSWAELSVDTEGMLLVKGPNVMKGYLGEAGKTEDVLRDGWYTTGDIAKIDQQGFITITGRLSRFSKIGGEMVPHIHIEAMIQEILDPNDEDEMVRAVVTSVADRRKGERLIVLYAQMALEPEEVCRRLSEQGMAKLWIPSPDSFYQVEEIPLLGTGKLDLKGMRELAKQRVLA